MNVIHVVGFVSAFLYLIFDYIYNVVSYYVILKPMPIWSLSSYCFSHNRYLVSLGLFFGSLGDIFLTYSYVEEYFLMGLFSFFIGHILYIIYFSDGVGFNRQGFIMSLIIFFTTMVVSYYIIPYIPLKLLLPVGIYIYVIMIMGITASFYNLYTAFGALFFLISDSIIAIDKFLIPIDNSSLWIMIFYYIGQWGIGYGACRKKI